MEGGNSFGNSVLLCYAKELRIDTLCEYTHFGLAIFFVMFFLIAKFGLILRERGKLFALYLRLVFEIGIGWCYDWYFDDCLTMI